MRRDPARFPNLGNFQGALPVPPHAATLTYHFVAQDDGTNWADDRDYRLDVSWEDDDAEEVGAYSGATETERARTLNGVGAGNLPVGNASFESKGELSYGHGRLRGNDRATGLGVRGPADYDAVSSDTDSTRTTSPAGPRRRTPRGWCSGRWTTCPTAAPRMGWRWTWPSATAPPRRMAVRAARR